MDKPKLKIGLLIDSLCIPKWQWLVIENIYFSDYGRVSLIILNESDNNKSIKSKFKGVNLKHLFYRLVMKIDCRLNKNCDNPFEPTQLNFLHDIPLIGVNPRKTKFKDYFLEEDLTKIEQYDVDLLIRFGFRILSGDLLKLPKHGVWSYHHGDNRVNRGGPAGFWEVLQNEGCTGATLQILSDDLDGGLVINRGIYATELSSFSKNRLSLYWKSMYLITDSLKLLYDRGEDFYLDYSSNYKIKPFYSFPLYKAPVNVELLFLVTKLFYKKLILKIREFCFDETWILAIRFNKGGQLGNVLYQFKPLIPPKGFFWADPFAIMEDEKNYVFFEEMKIGSSKGHISVIEINKKGLILKHEVVLKLDYHLSYPFIFKENGTYYMIPETSSVNRIELYVATEFPFKWEKSEILLDNVRAADVTLLKKDGKYWLFASVAKRNDVKNWDELCIYYSDRLIGGNWKAHCRNPVKRDVSNARPAGAIFQIGDILYRPAQNSSKRYGYSIQINEIITLSEENYAEIAIDQILPNFGKNTLGVHTINNSDNLTVIDILVRNWKLFEKTIRY